MIFYHRLIFISLLSLFSLNMLSQDIDISGFEEKYQEAIQSASRNEFDLSNAVIIIEPTCNSGNDGQLCFDPTLATGGIGPYILQFWTAENAQTSPNTCFTDRDAGEYGVLVLDQGQDQTCYYTFSVGEPSPVSVLFWNDITPACFDICDGQVDPLIVGGAGGFTYSYNGEPFTDNAFRDDLCILSTITIKDQVDCIVVDTVEWNDPPLEIVVDSIVKNTCFEMNDGLIDLTISGGNPFPLPNEPYIYSWIGPNGFTSNSTIINNLFSGTYTITITDQSPCSITKTYEILESAEIVFNPVITQLDCYGDTNGAIDPNVSGGTSPLTFQWTGPNVIIDAENQSNLPSGNFSLIVTDSIACTANQSFTIIKPDSMAITANIVPVSCFGDTDGAIVLSITGDPQLYSWDVPACYTGPTNIRDISNLCGGVYEITATDVNGCSISATFEVEEPSEIILEFTKTDIDCFGDNNGAINLNIIGGSQPPTTPTWSPMPFTINGNGIANLGPNTYTAEYIDNSGCTANVSVEIIEQGEIIVTENVVDASCSDIGDGSITIDIIGGVEEYTIIWSNALNQEIGNGLSINNLEAGTYSLAIVDAKGCNYNNTYTISSPTEIDIDINSIDPILCFGGNNGAIDINVSGGNNMFNYAWTGTAVNPSPSNQEDVNNLPAGTYTVVVSSGACTSSEIITIDPVAQMDLSFSTTELNCEGLENGAIDLTILNAAPIQTIQWTGSITSNDEDISGLAAGNYFVTVTDINGCSESGSVTLDAAQIIEISGVTTDVICYDGATGAVDLSISGNPQNTSFLWSGPNDFAETTEDISSLIAGDYNVIATIDGCPTPANFTITQNDSIYIESVLIPFPCNGNALGSIDITPHGGTPGYTYFWSGTGITVAESTLEDQVDLDDGIFQVIVTDNLQCFRTFEFELIPTSDMEINETITNISCFGLENGEITTNPSGGDAPYNFVWSGPDLFSSNSQNITNLSQGDHILSITDDSGCFIETVFAISEPDEIVININKTDPTCGNDDGSLTVNTIGGVGITTVTVTLNNVVVNDLSNLSAGVYIVKAVDSNGCESSQTVDLSNSDITINGTVNNVSCFGGNTGSISIMIEGAVGTTTINWIGDGPIDNPNGNTISNLIAGEYVVTVTDMNGCISSKIFEVIENDDILVAVDIENIFCDSDSDGSITITETIGGSGGYTFIWNSDIHDNVEGVTINNLPSGTYTLTVTDNESCSKEFVYQITNTVTLNIIGDITDVACFNDQTGSIDITVTGGTPSYSYSWSNGSADEDLSDVSAGEYTVTASDENQCSNIATFIVDSNSKLFGDAEISNISCNGADDGSITLINLGGNEPYNITWSNTISSIDQNISNLAAGDYNLNIVDQSLCVVDTVFTISEPDIMVVDGVVSDVICHGASTGSIIINSIIGGTGDKTVTWNPVPAGATLDGDNILNIPAGNYEITLVDDNGCILTKMFTVLNINTPITPVATITDVFCSGQNNGAIILQIDGGIPEYSVVWSGDGIINPLLMNQSNLSPGDYSVIITDNLNCSMDESFTIQQTNPLVINVISLQHNSCFGDQQGAIDIEIQGGTPEYFYTWTSDNGTFEQTQDISNLDGGIYNLHVEDINECEIDQQFSINEPTEIQFNLSVEISNCGLDNGSANVSNIVGGEGDHTVEWYNSLHIPIGSGNNIDDLVPGLYSVEVLDNNGCLVAKTFTISDNIGTLSTLVNELDCYNDNDGSLEASVSGFTRPITFEWTSVQNFTSTDSIITNLSADTYTLTITDALGCQIVESYVLSNPEELIASATQLNESCPNENDGSINLNVSGGTGNYTYAWTGVGIIQPQQQDQSNLPPNTYLVTITDGNECAIIKEFTILPAIDFTIQGVVNQISCYDENDGSIILTLDFDNNTPIDNISYNWVGPNVVQDSQNQFNLGPGEYTVTVSTPNNCLHSATYNINEPTEIVLDITTVSSTCSIDNGGASVVASGGVVANDYVYEWIEGNGNAIADNDNTIENVGAGLYEIVITDDTGCMVSQDFVISDLIGELTYDVTNISCPGLSDGSIDITYNNMVMPVGIIWSGPDGNYNPTDEDISGLPPGDYTVLITGNDGCILGDVIPVTELDEITSFANITNVSCFQLSNGVIDITINGGNSPYDVVWTDGVGNIIPSDPNFDLSNLSVGDYTIAITDTDGCTGTATYTITQPDEIIVISNVENIDCFGDNNGAVNIQNIDGGSTPYTFNWSQDGNIDFNATLQSIEGLSADTYNLLITDIKGCTYSETFEVVHNDLIQAEFTITPANCGLPTGEALVIATGGSGGYTYQWYDNDGFLLNESSNTITELVQDSYLVVITDENGCSESFDFEIQNEDYTVTNSITNNSCYGDANGQIEITLSNDFTYPINELSWEGPIENIPGLTTIENLIAGDYTLTLSDNNGCPFEETYTVAQPDSISIGSIIGNLNCFEDQSGSIVLSPTGGTPYQNSSVEYNFDWTIPEGVTDPGNIHFAENLIAGEYTIVVTDSLECTNDLQITLTEPQEITLVAAIQNVHCENDADGSIQVIVSGGTVADDYTYLWDTGNETNTLSNIIAGDYSLNISDDNQCTVDTTITITATIVIDMVFATEDITCFNDGDGSIELTATGGSNQFNITWNAEFDENIVDVNTESISGLTGGNYYLFLTDAVEGCVKMDTIYINNPDSLHANVLVSQPLCFGDNNGAISVESQGGTSPYVFAWTSIDDPGFSENTESVINLSAGNYNFQMVDDHLCTKEYNFEIVEPEVLSLTIDNMDNAYCYSSEDGNISTTVNGGTPTYTVQWTGSTGAEYEGEIITNVLPGIYSVEITDDNQCLLTEQVTLNYDVEVKAVIEDQIPACEQLSVVLNGTESIGATTYSWYDINNNIISNEPTVPVVLSLDYDLFVLEVSNGTCAHSDTLDLIVHPLPNIDAGPDLEAFQDEEIIIGGNPSGPTAIEFDWSPGTLLSDSTLANPTYFNIGTQEFFLTITDFNGCTNIDSMVVELINQVEIPDGFSPNGDGTNDLWMIANSGKFPDMVVKVYNRWGDKLFDSKGYNAPWNGEYDNKNVPVGTYYYVIELHDPLFPKPMTGPLTIFR